MTVKGEYVTALAPGTPFENPAFIPLIIIAIITEHIKIIGIPITKISVINILNTSEFLAPVERKTPISFFRDLILEVIKFKLISNPNIPKKIARTIRTW
jgi:hypothetical protein